MFEQLEPKRRRPSPPANTGKRRRLDDDATNETHYEAAGRNDHHQLQPQPAAVVEDGHSSHDSSREHMLHSPASSHFHPHIPSPLDYSHPFTQGLAPTDAIVSETSAAPSMVVATDYSASSASGFSPGLLMDPLPATRCSQSAGGAGLPPRSPDDYNCNPTFLASHEELRSLLFNTAQSTQPTRAPSPEPPADGGRYVDDSIDRAGGRGVGQVGAPSFLSTGRGQMKQILGTSKRVEYLKNYLAKVAPWWKGRGISITQSRKSLLITSINSLRKRWERTLQEAHMHNTLSQPRHALPLVSMPMQPATVVLTRLFNQLDMFDTSRHFGITVPALAQSQPPLLYAILALSARQIERLKSGSGGFGRRARANGGGHTASQNGTGNKHYSGSSSFESLELYQEAIRLLTPKLPERSPHILTCCVLLCCLEMMSASPQDWRRHLEGCATLFDSFDVNGFSGGLMQAVFWCYVRMDLCGALISDGTESTLLAVPKWVPANMSCDDDAVYELFASRRSPDMHANHAVYLCSKVCELLSDRTKYAELGVDNGCTGPAYALRWKRLWHELARWLDERPPELLPARTIRQTHDKPFPEILFVHWAAISSNQLYHTACILLLTSMPERSLLRLGFSNPSLPQQQQQHSSPLWHARRVCGISLSNPHEGCLNNACQPLWIAGRLLGHHSEHAAVIELIRNIEARTGWGMYWRIRDLEEAWGYRTR